MAIEYRKEFFDRTYTAREAYARVWKYARKYRIRIVVGIVCGMLTTDAQLLLGVLLEPYDKGLADEIFARTAIHKLTHKYPPAIIAPDMFARRIFVANTGGEGDENGG